MPDEFNPRAPGLFRWDTKLFVLCAWLFRMACLFLFSLENPEWIYSPPCLTHNFSISSLCFHHLNNFLGEQIVHLIVQILISFYFLRLWSKYFPQHPVLEQPPTPSLCSSLNGREKFRHHIKQVQYFRNWFIMPLISLWVKFWFVNVFMKYQALPQC